MSDVPLPPQPQSRVEEQVNVRPLKKRIAVSQLTSNIQKRRRTETEQKLREEEEAEANLEAAQDEEQVKRVERALKYTKPFQAKRKTAFERLARGEQSFDEKKKLKALLEQKQAIAALRQNKKIRDLEIALEQCQEKVQVLEQEVEEASDSINSLIDSFQALTAE